MKLLIHRSTAKRVCGWQQLCYAFRHWVAGRIMTRQEDGFADFLAQIEAAPLRDIAAHWNEVRQSRRMPAWQDIDPARIAAHLPIVWSWRYDRTNGQFVGRLIGQAIADLFGKSIRGVKMEDYFQGAIYEAVHSRCHRVVTEPCFARDHGNIFRYRDRFCLGERIILPLADAGADADGVFGATVFDQAPDLRLEHASFASDILNFHPL